jgi:NADH dehydrogenase FAD-containing subunit
VIHCVSNIDSGKLHMYIPTHYYKWPNTRPLLDQQQKTFALDYDKLVISVGSYSNTFGIPGVKEHAFFLKDVNDARKIRKRLIECK